MKQELSDEEFAEELAEERHEELIEAVTGSNAKILEQSQKQTKLLEKIESKEFSNDTAELIAELKNIFVTNQAILKVNQEILAELRKTTNIKLVRDKKTTLLSDFIISKN